jgi:hypothetical protein
MSAVAFAGAHRGWEDAGHGGEGAPGARDAGPAQPRLFALPGGALEDAPPVVEADAPATVVEARAGTPVVAAPRAVPGVEDRGPAPVALAAVLTLDDVLLGAWNAVATGAASACPICQGELRPRWSAGAGAVGGRCQDCGTLLD